MTWHGMGSGRAALGCGASSLFAVQVQSSPAAQNASGSAGVEVPGVEPVGAAMVPPHPNLVTVEERVTLATSTAEQGLATLTRVHLHLHTTFLLACSLPTSR